MLRRSGILECLATTLGEVPGSDLGISDRLAAALGNVLGSGLGILDGVAATRFSGVLAMARA